MEGGIDIDRFYRPKQIMERLGISKATMYKLRRTGKIPDWDRCYGEKIAGYWGSTLANVISSLKPEADRKAG